MGYASTHLIYWWNQKSLFPFVFYKNSILRSCATRTMYQTNICSISRRAYSFHFTNIIAVARYPWHIFNSLYIFEIAFVLNSFIWIFFFIWSVSLSFFSLFLYSCIHIHLTFLCAFFFKCCCKNNNLLVLFN